ncbi:MAG: DUF3667 domain-containing protein [Sphingobacteriia bacterium]|nr:MAG: DUF3667 domain-containing protein [Sphingobacteriia bacterium]
MPIFIKISTVSHLPERAEKVCLNCNAVLEGRFCHICGQENIAPRESFWNMLTHFVFDLFHFDGKFFSTIKYLLFSPGILTKEHLKGRRASYLHPIRMYVFTSAFFFLIFFNFFQDTQGIIKINETTNRTVAGDIAKLNEKKQQLEKSKLVLDKLSAKSQSDSLQAIINQINNDLLVLQRDSTMKGKVKSLNTKAESTTIINGDTIRAKTLAEYDSTQNALPPAIRNGYVNNKLKRQVVYLEEKYNGNYYEIRNVVWEKFVHVIPQLLFVSLPLFAFVLFLLYSRRKTYFYSDHLVYTLHVYCAFFIMILAALILSAAAGYIYTPASEWVRNIMGLILLFYWYKSIRHFYGQSRAKSILKFILLYLINIVLMLTLFIGFFLFSAMTIH